MSSYFQKYGLPSTLTVIIILAAGAFWRYNRILASATSLDQVRQFQGDQTGLQFQNAVHDYISMFIVIGAILLICLVWTSKIKPEWFHVK